MSQRADEKTADLFVDGPAFLGVAQKVNPRWCSTFTMSVVFERGLAPVTGVGSVVVGVLERVCI